MAVMRVRGTDRWALAPLSVPDFRRLLGGNALWWLTMFMETIAIGWLVLELTNSAWSLALVGFCRSIPLLLFGFAAGALTDRIGRRRVILTAQAVTLTLYGLMAWLAWAGVIGVWQLGLISFGLGCAWAFDWPARRAVIPDLIGKALTLDAMLLESFLQGIARMAGPVLAGWLIAVYGAAGCFAAMALFSAAALWSLLGLPRSPAVTTTHVKGSAWSSLGASIRYAAGNQVILGVLLITIVLNLWLIPYMTLLPMFARDVLGQGPVGLGLLGAASGIGSFIGLLLIGVLRRSVSNGMIFLGGTFALAMALVVFSQSTWYGLSWAMLLIAGIGQLCFGIMQSSIILIAAIDEMRSRVLGLLVIAIGADPFGKLETGLLAELFGAPAALGIQAVLGAIAVAVIAIALPGLRGRASNEPPIPAPASAAAVGQTAEIAG